MPIAPCQSLPPNPLADQPHYAMSTQSAVARAAPIAIAAKPSKLKTEASVKDSIRPKAWASKAGEAPNARRKDRPCDACRRRKSKCVMREGEMACLLCKFHNQDCTFVQSPQPRKRKLNGDGKDDPASKRRYAYLS